MKLTYDPNADAVYIKLSRHQTVVSEEVTLGVVFDFDADHKLVGIEVLNAKARVATDMLEAAAE